MTQIEVEALLGREVATPEGSGVIKGVMGYDRRKSAVKVGVELSCPECGQFTERRTFKLKDVNIVTEEPTNETI